MNTWRSIAEIWGSERQRVLQLAKYRAIEARARRVYWQDYDQASLSAREAELTREREEYEERLAQARAADPSYVEPIGTPLHFGTKPWLDGVPLQQGVEDWAEVPLEIFGALDDSAWRSGRHEHPDPADYRRSWLYEGIEVREPSEAAEQPSTSPGPQWTVHEAVAWLATGDEVLVESTADWARQTNGEGKDGWLQAWTRLAVEIRDRRGNPNEAIFEYPDAVREKLRAASEMGKVRTSGIPADHGPRRAISTGDFVGAEIWHGQGLSLHRAVGGQSEPAAWLEVRFDSADVRALDETHEETAGEKRRRSPGRTPGSGSYAPLDAPLLEEMKRLLAERQELSVNGAAKLVADRAAGASFEAKVTRLRKAYVDLENNGAK